MRELTDEMVADFKLPVPGKPLPGIVIEGRHVAEVAEHPDGRLAVLTWSSPKIDPGLLHPALHVVDPRTGTIRNLGETPADASSPVWWGDEIVYLAITPPHLQGGLAVFDQNHRNLTEGMPACPIELVQDNGNAPLMLVATGLDTEFHRLGEGLLGRIKGSHQPGRTEPDDVPWGVQERLHYRASDGLDLDGLLVLPVHQSRDDGPFPLVTLVHGGPYDRWTDDLQLHWVPSAQWFAHQGIATFLPNPRGGLGHGHEFAAAVSGRVGQEEWSDIETGIDLLIAQGVADPDRLGICGWSHGGFMAAWAVTQTDRFKAALVGAGIVDWPRQIATGEWGAFEAALGDSAEHSPITYADRIRTPLLIVHGADDTNVPLEQAKLLHHAVECSELVVYPGEGHSLKQRENKLDLLQRAREFFAQL